MRGTYVRDKDAVDGAFLICEMFAYYREKGISLLDKLNELYSKYGFCLNTLHSYEFEGAKGFDKMQQIMKQFRSCLKEVGGKKVLKCLDYSLGIEGLPKSNVLKYFLEDNCTVVIRPSGTEPKLKLYLSVSAKDRNSAESVEKEMQENLKQHIL